MRGISKRAKRHNYISPLTYILKFQAKKIFFKFGAKKCFFTQKMPKICVTWVKSEKGTISYPLRPMFKISWKNCEPSQRYGPDKISREEEERKKE